MGVGERVRSRPSETETGRCTWIEERRDFEFLRRTTGRIKLPTDEKSDEFMLSERLAMSLSLCSSELARELLLACWPAGASAAAAAAASSPTTSSGVGVKVSFLLFCLRWLVLRTMGRVSTLWALLTVPGWLTGTMRLLWIRASLMPLTRSSIFCSIFARSLLSWLCEEEEEVEEENKQGVKESHRKVTFT